MSGAIPLLHHFVFMAWRGTISPFEQILYFINSNCVEKGAGEGGIKIMAVLLVSLLC
jgi:hypothetical protein